MTRFPEGFLWGAATAGHQIEGNNTLSDHWPMEHAPNSPFVEPSGDACDSYHRFAEDIALLAQAGLNTYRFSVEWSRVEPEPGVFSRAELDHYLRMVESCRAAGVTPVITLSHFTVPIWFARGGTWYGPDAPESFARYCETVAAHMGDALRWYCTLNEPNLGAMMTLGGSVPMAALEQMGAVERPDPEAVRAFAARIGADPRAVRFGHLISTPEGIAGITRAHRLGREAVKRANPAAKVGWTLAIPDVQSIEGGEELAAALRDKGVEEFLRVSREDDFVGVQTYTREVLGPGGRVPPPEDAPVFQTGWEVYPPALGNAVRLAARVAGVPVLVTENGMATSDDVQRIGYTAGALRGLRDCVEDGIDVLGYLHWSLLDNFEWHSGYAMTFGLVAVDRTTFERTPKPSLGWLGAVARDNGTALEVPRAG